VSLKIKYDNQTVSFSGIENGAVNFQYSENDGVITIGWFDITLMNPINIQNDNLFNLIFDISSGSSTLEFLEESCEISNSLGEAIPINYINGSITTVTSVDDDNSSQQEYYLFQNYPNPFNSSTKISFILKGKERVTLKIFNSLGQEVRSLINSELETGRYNINFDAEDLSSGVYFCQLKSGSFSSFKKLILNK